MRVFSVVAFCASHIDGLERLKCFRAMIASWSKQSFPVYLYVCISSDDAMNAVLQRVIEQLKAEYLLLRICTHPGRLAQFEHYRCLTEHFERSFAQGNLPEDLYVIFTDDDDLWHPNRTASYLQLYEQIASSSEGTSLGPFALGSIVDATTPVKAYSAADVDSLISSGSLPFNRQTYPQDYVALCVPFKLVSEFVSKASPELLRHRYADACFFTFVRAKAPGMKLGQSADWMYFYRFDDTRPQAALSGASDDDGAFSFILAYCPTRSYDDVLKARDHCKLALSDAVIKRLLENPASAAVEAIKGAPL